MANHSKNMENFYDAQIKRMEKSIERAESIAKSKSTIKQALKNIGRAMLGKEQKDITPKISKKAQNKIADKQDWITQLKKDKAVHTANVDNYINDAKKRVEKSKSKGIDITINFAESCRSLDRADECVF